MRRRRALCIAPIFLQRGRTSDRVIRYQGVRAYQRDRTHRTVYRSGSRLIVERTCREASRNSLQFFGAGFYGKTRASHVFLELGHGIYERVYHSPATLLSIQRQHRPASGLPIRESSPLRARSRRVAPRRNVLSSRDSPPFRRVIARSFEKTYFTVDSRLQASRRSREIPKKLIRVLSNVDKRVLNTNTR